MSPVNVSFGFSTPSPDPVIAPGGQLTLNTWQQNSIKSVLGVIHDAFNVSFAEGPSSTADITFAGAMMDQNGQPPLAYGVADRLDGSSKAHVWFGGDRAEYTDQILFGRVAAREIADALTLGPNSGPAHTTYNDINGYPYPGTNLFSVEDLVALGTKFGSNFHLAAGDRVVGELYLGVFGRMGHAAGLIVQVNAVHSGTSLVNLANAFLNTAEGLAMFGADHTGDAFVGHLYQNVLGRQSDPAGQAVQVYALQHGTNPGQLVVNLIQSAEFQERIHSDFLFT